MELRGSHKKGLFPAEFQRCVSKTDVYTRCINLRPSIRRSPFSKRDIDLILYLIEHNKSFITSKFNPNPPEFHRPSADMLPSDIIKNVDIFTKVDSLFNTIQDGRRGLLVLFNQPPDDIDLRNTRPREDAEWRVVCGAIVKIGSELGISKNGREHESYSEERDILGVFCIDGIPSDVEDELMKVLLSRTIAEAVCYEEMVEQDERVLRKKRRKKKMECSGNEEERDELTTKSKISMRYGSRDNRFMSIETNNLILCPTSFAKLVTAKDMGFYVHLDEEYVFGEKSRTKHEKGRKCPCVKKNRKCQYVYQYYTLSASTTKGGISGWVPDSPSTAAVNFFLKPGTQTTSHWRESEITEVSEEGESVEGESQGESEEESAQEESQNESEEEEEGELEEGESEFEGSKLKKLKEAGNSSKPYVKKLGRLGIRKLDGLNMEDNSDKEDMGDIKFDECSWSSGYSPSRENLIHDRKKRKFNS